MIDKLNSLIVILNFGSLVLLAFLKLTNPLKANRTANRWFGTFLLLWASFWTEEIMVLAFGVNLNAVPQFFLRCIQFFTPVLFYFSVVKYSNPGFRIKKGVTPHLILPAVYIIMLFLSNHSKTPSTIISYAPLALILGMAMFYSLASYFRIRKHQRFVLSFSSDTRGVDLFWLERIIIAVLIFIVISIFYNIIFLSEPLNLFMNLVLLVVIFYVAFHSLGQKEIYPFSEAKRDEIITLIDEPETEKLKIKIVPDEELILVKSDLNHFMLKQKPYLDPELNLVKLSELFGTTPHRLSYIINTGFNKNFFNFVNHYRIEEAKVLLLKPEMEQYSVLGIAFESGFNSKTTFNNTFKKITGLTPTGFRKMSLPL